MLLIYYYNTRTLVFALFNFRFETILLLVKNSMGEIGGIKGLKPEKLMTSINFFLQQQYSPQRPEIIISPPPYYMH